MCLICYFYFITNKTPPFMKHKHIFLTLPTVIVVGYVLFFDLLDLNLGPNTLLAIVIALPVLLWVALFIAARNSELSDYPETRIFVFLLGIVASIPLGIYLVGRHREVHIWIINSLIIVAVQAVIMASAYFEKDTIAAHHFRSQSHK